MNVIQLHAQLLRMIEAGYGALPVVFHAERAGFEGHLEIDCFQLSERVPAKILNIGDDEEVNRCLELADAKINPEELYERSLERRKRVV